MSIQPLILVFALLGITLIYGAYRKWKWLVDPPTDEWWSFLYSQVVVKKLLGRKGIVLFTYGLGVIFVGVSIMYFTRGLWQ